MMLVTRSKPMPVSTRLAGNGENVPSGFALNWMKTMARKRSSLCLGNPVFGFLERKLPRYDDAYLGP